MKLRLSSSIGMLDMFDILVLTIIVSVSVHMLVNSCKTQ